MIGHELWDRTMFGGAMILLGAIFTIAIWDKSFLLAIVGIANILFGTYVIWGAFAWEEYKKEIYQKHDTHKQTDDSSSLN